MEHPMKPQIEQLVDYIMKKCCSQFHSRAWDREKQNAGILGKTTQLPITGGGSLLSLNAATG